MRKRTISDVKVQNENIGHYFFSRNTMKFFQSRIESALYADKYFITSEQPPHGKRRFSVRMARPDGAIDTVSSFNQFADVESARAFIRALLKSEKCQSIK